MCVLVRVCKGLSLASLPRNVTYTCSVTKHSDGNVGLSVCLQTAYTSLSTQLAQLRTDASAGKAATVSSAQSAAMLDQEAYQGRHARLLAEVRA